ncbi:MAG: SDR family NAD(P)-dependent oxidoreductase [Deltaproteobacteria bacterium]|nr:SDR family NAD(P)-dependent oxidoreductase [Deltaproteobacteria bacterium]
MADAERGTVLITGGNSGLGLACADAIVRAAPSRTIVLASRDLERSRAAARALRERHPEVRIEARALDLGSLADVRAFAERFSAELRAADVPPLRALVLNAGLQFTRRTRSLDGFEATFAVNHLGHYLLAHLLLPWLAAPARIVFVSSGTHDPAQRTGMPAPRYRGARKLADPDDDGGDASEALFGRRAYTTSKLCNVLCAYELSRRLEACGRSIPEAPITVNAFDPGLMPGTGLARDYAGWQRALWRFVLPALRVLPKVNSTQASGAALARLVVDESLDGTTRQYFEGMRAIPSSELSYDLELARELWEESASLTGLAAAEQIGATPSARAATSSA